MHLKFKGFPIFIFLFNTRKKRWGWFYDLFFREQLNLLNMLALAKKNNYHKRRNGTPGIFFIPILFILFLFFLEGKNRGKGE